MKSQASQASESAKSLHRSSTVSSGQSEGAGSKAEDSTVPAELVSKGEKLDGTPSQPKFRRDTSTFQVDNHLKSILVTGSGDVSDVVVIAMFQNKESVAKLENGWLIDLLSRRATKSTIRAIGSLKRGFGPNTRAQIILRSLPESSGEQSIAGGEWVATKRILGK